MKLDIRRNGGRVLMLTHGEDFCKNCGLKRGDKRTLWYYYDNKYSKGLYCRDCAVNEPGLFVDNEKQNCFWCVDEFEFYNEVKKNA